MTAPQKYASALTFAKRYSLINILGIATGDEDTDATDVGKEKGAKSPKSKIVFLLKTLGDDTKTKESIADAVIKHTGLDLEEANLVEIVSRLEVLVRQKNEDTEVRK
jgi:ERF superfamily